MEPTHKSGNNDISEIGQDIFRPDGYSFYDELSDTEVIEEKEEAGKRDIIIKRAIILSLELKLGGIFLFNIEHPVFIAGINQD